MLARLQGVSFAVYAQGVGPLTSPTARRMVQVVFDDAAQITVRDADSARLVGELGVTVPVEVTADPAFSLTPDDEEVCHGQILLRLARELHDAERGA